MPRIWNWLRTRALRYFLAGVFAILPLVVTAAVVIWVAGFLQRFVGPNAPLGHLLRIAGLGFSSDTTMAYIIGWALVLIVIMVVGMFAEAGARGFFQRLLDALAQPRALSRRDLRNQQTSRRHVAQEGRRSALGNASRVLQVWSRTRMWCFGSLGFSGGVSH